MRTWSSAFNLISIYILLLLLVVFYQGEAAHVKDYEELHLRFVSDYATEAAFRTTLDTEDIEHVYWDMGGVRNDPALLLKVFKAVFTMNYDVSGSEENYERVESFIPTGVLATRDGMYSLKHTELERDSTYGTKYGLAWSIKHPYQIEGLLPVDGVPLKGVFAAGLPRADGEGNNPWVFVTKARGVLEVYEDDYPVVALNGRVVRKTVSELITEEINYNIYERNREDLLRAKTPQFFLPREESIKGINSIDRPTLIMMVQNVDFGRTKNLSSVSVGGSKVIRKRMVAGFREGGSKYYCYETQLPEDKIADMRVSGELEHFYNTVEEAAEAGYRPHLLHLTKPLEKVR